MISRIISMAYSSSHIISNIPSGFKKTELQDWNPGTVSVRPLEQLSYTRTSGKAISICKPPTVQEIVLKFERRSRDLYKV